jgi:hypothetical protein
LAEDINLEKIQNNDMEDKMNPKSGEIRSQILASRRVKIHPIYGQQKQYS